MTDAALHPSDSVPAAPDAPAAVDVRGIVKTYRTGFWLNQKVVPLKNATLSVPQGKTFGLLGPNGAGKTTLLKVMLGIIRPTAGKGTLLGRPLGDRATKQRVGYLPENPYFYDYLTGWEFLEFAAELFKLPRSVRQKRIPRLLDLVGLDRGTARDRQMRQYSKGMLQRIGMAQALINEPDLVFLDEPMSGLDPLGRYQIREIILSLKEQGRTIFFNSHVLSDVEQVCDRVAILARGELLCSGSLDELLGSGDAYQVRGRGGTPEVLDPWVEGLEFQAGYWHGQLHGDPQKFVQALEAADAQLLSLTRDRPTLEQFFVRQLRDRGLVTSQ